MDFQQTHCRAHAFTLPELMVSMAIGALCATALAGFLFLFSRNSTAIVSFATINSADRQSLNAIARDFREAESFVSLSPTNLSVHVNGSEVQFYYDPSSKALVRNSGSHSEFLLHNCEGLSFSFLQRNPITPNFETFQVSTSSTCRILELSWVSVVREDKQSRWTVTNSARFLNRRGLSD